MPECDLTLLDNHEIDSKRRYCEFQKDLGEITTNEKALKILAEKVDIQLKLEDFLLKSREANHATIKVWGTIFAPAIISAIVSIVVTVLALLVRLR